MARSLWRRRRDDPPAHPAVLKQARKQRALRACARRCVYCGTGLDETRATLDHVHPRALGGTDDEANLVIACRRCNAMKRDLSPAEFFYQYPWAGLNFLRYARAVPRTFKRMASRAVSLAYAAA